MKVLFLICACVAVLQLTTARKANSQLDCRPNETYTTCGPCNERVCGVPFEPIYCLMCPKGCFCNKGYVRKVPNGACIKPTWC
ncbi:chymotrypsin-elastase inhibitor ixodidin-like [Uranotaenia lowii]|uniref:chymotrypsin-elastase inhibitor ixodidin-like n=1 Tax=Uranotaenia lowii TaxID=190385 RepID=UPI00247A6378|nr:chymotrypsin-elastase inhibitor ixodidin-like [Uranotaenia lowii]